MMQGYEYPLYRCDDKENPEESEYKVNLNKQESNKAALTFHQ